ncbi:MAG TPA: hypothetical protein VGC79_19115 [Polyangiaceae bacterium]
MPNWKRLRGSGAGLIALALLSVSFSGCTLVGAGVGAGIDSLIPGPYEQRPAAELVRLERDERVLVVRRNGTRVSGRYRGTHGPTGADLERYLLISADDHLVSVKGSEVSSVAVEVTGKGWLYGGLIGLAADVVVIVVASQFDLYNTPSTTANGSSGCFC